MAYTFKDTTDLLLTYKFKAAEAKKDAERIRIMIALYEEANHKGSTTSPEHRDNINRNMRSMGGVNYQRENLRGLQATALAWSTAAEMLKAYMMDHPEKDPISLTP